MDMHKQPNMHKQTIFMQPRNVYSKQANLNA